MTNIGLVVDLADCAAWPGPRGTNGYGKRRYKGRDWLAHRAAWDERFGGIPSGMQVLHHCDNRICVNIDHLFLGTQKDNMVDMVAKGRAVIHRGADHVNSRLTADDVAEIHELYRSGMLQRDIGRRYGLSRQGISKVVRGVTYSLDGLPDNGILSSVCASCGDPITRTPWNRRYCDASCKADARRVRRASK